MFFKSFILCSSEFERLVEAFNDGFGEVLFDGCNKLTGVSIPDNITSIGTVTVRGCDNLVYNEYSNAYYLGNETNPYVVLIKAKSKGILTCEINDKTKYIAYRAFYNCSSLENIVIPSSVICIDSNAFEGCYTLVNIIIPKNVQVMNFYTFYGCTNLTVYCEIGSEPREWSFYWKYCPGHSNGTSYCSIVWGYENETNNG